ncbi:MAG: tRNA (N6-threonylcarbamoyladenosine(37)-N6)-methyltransferase TrmO [Bdellovibrionaceae bacterium]|nr:tRNA (N6-threonylcarbamoyladenosine(37)-N6)-methyltransferase TrmO [Pseudobdellovibrionaceae bacterium]
MVGLELKPIGYCRNERRHPYDQPRQGPQSSAESLIELLPNNNFEQALTGLSNFERIWIIFQFHQNKNWKPMVTPPRSKSGKMGVFATRSPHRPNPLGLSCVRLLSVHGLCLKVSECDLLDGTPVFDIKPYIPYADAFPQAKAGWTENLDAEKLELIISPQAESSLRWLESHGLSALRDFLESQLCWDPTNTNKKRVTMTSTSWSIAYRTWRILFTIKNKTVNILEIRSGYSPEELDSPLDPWGDKSLHRAFSELIKHESKDNPLRD